MNVLYLSCHFPLHYYHFAERLAERGITVLGITDQADEQLCPPLRAALSGHYRVDTLDNRDQVMEACEFFTRHFGPIDRVESHIETWLELEADIRERYSVPGFTHRELPFIKRKSMMKDTFRRGGVPTVRGIVLESLEQARAFIGGSYPVFIKPDKGVGACDTHTIRSEEDLARFFEERGSCSYFLEEFVEASTETFDGLTDRNGEIVFSTSHVYSTDVHKVVVEHQDHYYYSRRSIPEDLRRMGTGTVKAAGIREKFFHIEFFRLPNGELRGLEINCRPPGGLTTHMFNYACDVDVYDWWASVIAGDGGRRDFDRRYHVVYTARKLGRTYVLSHDELVERLGPRLVLWQEMHPMEWQAMGHTGYLVRSPDLDELLKMVRLVTMER